MEPIVARPPASGFTSTSSLEVAPWHNGAWNLQPDGAYGFFDFLPSEDIVTVTEGPKSGWNLTDITCQNGAGTSPGQECRVHRHPQHQDPEPEQRRRRARQCDTRAGQDRLHLHK